MDKDDLLIASHPTFRWVSSLPPRSRPSRWRSTACRQPGCWGSLRRHSWPRSKSDSSLVSLLRASLRSGCSSSRREWGRASLRWDCRSWWGRAKMYCSRHSYLRKAQKWWRRRREGSRRQIAETSSLLLRLTTKGFAGFYSLVHLFCRAILFKQVCLFATFEWVLKAVRKSVNRHRCQAASHCWDQFQNIKETHVLSKRNI